MAVGSIVYEAQPFCVIVSLWQNGLLAIQDMIVKTRNSSVVITLVFLFSGSLAAQVPQLINYQGRVVVGNTNFNSTGQFKFALVNTNGSTTYWSNDGTSSAGSQPTNAVSLPVTNGLYSVLLGDTTLTNMTAISTSVFNNSDVRLRVWFNDGTHGSQQLTPDQRIASVGYAMMAATVPTGSVDITKLAPNAKKAALVFNVIGLVQTGTALTLTGNISFNGWSMPPPASQYDLPLSFGVPEDLDSSQPVTVDVHFVTPGNASPAPPGNVVLSCNSLFAGNTVNSSFTTTIATPKSVAEPTPAPTYIPYNHCVVTFTLSGQATPGTFALLDFTRTSPADSFSHNIFLTGVTVHYTRN